MGHLIRCFKDIRSHAQTGIDKILSRDVLTTLFVDLRGMIGKRQAQVICDPNPVWTWS